MSHLQQDGPITGDDIEVSIETMDGSKMISSTSHSLEKESISLLDEPVNDTEITEMSQYENIENSNTENVSTSVIPSHETHINNMTTLNIYENKFENEIVNSDYEREAIENLGDVNFLAKKSKSCIIDIENENKNNNKYKNSFDKNKDINQEQFMKDGKCQYDSVSLTEPCCRVCQCSGEEESLISPCHCSGSVKWVHESCLVHWMKSSFKDSCELCLSKIEIAKRIKPLSKWTLPSRRPTPVVWVLVFVTAIALNLASIVKDASRLCSTTPCLVFYAVGCMGIILGSLFLIFWTKRARSFFNHWLEQNEEWVVILEKKTDQNDQDQKKKEKNEDPKV